MSSTELVLKFSSNTQVNVSFDGTESGRLDFANPVTAKDRTDIRWYVETYGSASLAEPDDKEAERIQARLREIGKAIFRAVFDKRAAQRVFNRFQDAESQQRVLTINSQDASILSLPWELLHDPSGAFLFREKPHISVRRKITGATGGRQPFQVISKDRLHLLFVVSRPTDVGFIDPRADPRAVLDALDKYAPGRVTCEFLRPATLNALVTRLDDETRPAVDILHFDGHGAFMQVPKKDAEKDPGLNEKSIHSEIQRERQARKEDASGKTEGIGFLVFEKEDRTTHLISAEDLGDNLFRSKVALVVLSACQTAATGDPMASVAGKLTSTGIPAILAMTHSVLVATTRTLFDKFYESLARGRGIATALDDARVYLANNPEKFEVRRGNERKMLELEDWFVPALYHGGADSPLLTKQPADSATEVPVTKNNLRKPHEAGFFGRRRELWDIAYWFATAETRRISITGFGGQGKTELAMEAGRWLLRTGMFECAVFIDYSAVQSEDALSIAVSTMSAVLEESFTDAESATKALAQMPTLVILDNLEAISPDALGELLAAAVDWSKAGDSRVLLTSRIPDLNHPDYRIEGTRIHRRIPLEGLGSADYPDDALEWFGELSKLPSADESDQVSPPERNELIRLCDRVGFHPLSIAVLAQQLRTRTARDLGKRLEQILSGDAVSGIAIEGTPPSLIASLLLSLERLSETERHAVRRLGVFQGGAMESELLAITELGESDEERKQLEALLAALESGDPRAILGMMGKKLPADAEAPAELLVQLTGSPEFEKHVQQLRSELANIPATKDEAGAENLWPGLRRQLAAAALIEAESVPGVGPPFFRFHPTLAPMLWAGLNGKERTQLTLAHRQRYYALTNYLYHEDAKNPHQARAIATRELPNLLHAVHQALDAGDPDAVQFVTAISRFLNFFGMTREAASLTRRADAAGGERGSRAWYLARSNRGEKLLASRQVGEATKIFSDILQTLGDKPSYELAATLAKLGRCDEAGGHPDLAEVQHLRCLDVIQKLEQSDRVKKLCAALHTDLGDALRDQGKFDDARDQYEKGLKISVALNDSRGQGVKLGQLGSLAEREGNLAEAVERHQEALKLFRRLDEPAMEAVAHNQLGIVYDRASQFDLAEQHYRESANLEEKLGNLAGAANTWTNLAITCRKSGKPEAAETWYRKAIEAFQAVGRKNNLATCFNNLANLLQNQPERLAEARQLAEEALGIKKDLDPGAAAIWTTYSILAKIADQESEPDQAAEYRRLFREAKRNFAGTGHEMKQFATVIAAVVGAVAGNEEAKAFANQIVEQGRQADGEEAEFAKSIERILAGERDADALTQNLTNFAAVVETMLAALEDPTVLANLLPKDDDS